MKMINLGCGSKIHEAFINLDVSSDNPDVIKCNFLSGIPYSDNAFDVVYHSHVLEHFSKDDGVVFIKECYRILKPGGVIRIAVPDLENIVRQYLKNLELALAGESLASYNYDWMMLELYDQTVRSKGGGSMGEYLTQDKVLNECFVRDRIGSFYGLVRKDVENKLAPSGFNLIRMCKSIVPASIFNFLKNIKNNLFNFKVFRYYRLGKFRQSGEIHQWMYDRYSLSKLLEESGFKDVKIQSATDSYIDNWSSYFMDADKDGGVYKKDSLFIEGIK